MLDVREVAYELQGTCGSLDAILEEADFDPPIEWFYELDGLVFCCAQCNWWFEQSQMSEISDWVCVECEEEI